MGSRKRIGRISDLPDEIISHILSSLPIKQSALTSVLSHRWRNLFAFRPNLHLHDDLEQVGNGQSFADFVDRVLAVSGNLPFRKVSIKCQRIMPSAHANRWLIDLLRRASLVSLDLDIIKYEEQAILLPPEMFTCKTIVELRLAKGFLATLPDDVSLPSLKTLFIASVYFRNRKYCVLGKLLSACPVLEELTIRGNYWQNPQHCRTVSSSTLKKLTIMCTNCFIFWGISFHTPNLAYLEFSDLVPRDYPFVNLESLVEAKLDLRLPIGGICNPTNLLKGLRNVKVLELSSSHTSDMIYHSREAIPVFNNLLRLSITINSYGYGWQGLPVLVKNSPNLETIVIKGPFLARNRRREFGSSCSVKVLKITEYGGKTEELKQLKSFLKKLSRVELVKVRACALNDTEKSRVTKDLLTMVPRSSKCKIHIKFSE